LEDLKTKSSHAKVSSGIGRCDGSADGRFISFKSIVFSSIVLIQYLLKQPYYFLFLKNAFLGDVPQKQVHQNTNDGVLHRNANRLLLFIIVIAPFGHEFSQGWKGQGDALKKRVKNLFATGERNILELFLGLLFSWVVSSAASLAAAAATGSCVGVIAASLFPPRVETALLLVGQSWSLFLLLLLRSGVGWIAKASTMVVEASKIM
jgi:hypothetical protein